MQQIQIKVLFLLLYYSFIPLSIIANSKCSSYYNPSKYYDIPQYFQDYLDENLNNLELFGSAESYRVLNFKRQKNLYLNEYIKLEDYLFPKNNGIFSYKIVENKVDEISFANINLYKLSAFEIANEINNDFEGFWSDWEENAYEMILVPQQVLFKYKNKYFSFSVFIYGVKGDATNLNGTIIKYSLKDYTKYVNEYNRCKNINHN